MPKAIRQRYPGHVPESAVLSACIEALQLYGIWHERRNTLPVWVETNSGKRRPVKVAEPGTADIYCTPVVPVLWLDYSDRVPSGAELPCTQIVTRFKPGLPCSLWIETKSDHGKQRPDQKAFEATVTAAGHYYLLARSVDDLLFWLKQHGVSR